MKQLHPKAVWLLMVQYFYRWLYLGFFILWVSFVFESYEYLESLGRNKFLVLALAVLIAFFVLLYFWSKLAYKLYRYELTDNGIKKEYGVIWKKYITIPYNRIQNVDILRGIIARLLGLSDLQIQTAGMSGFNQKWGASNSEGRLPGLSTEVAEQLRDELIRRAQGSKGQGL